jgi:nascent polypeptide-associated complex subunit alpha
MFPGGRAPDPRRMKAMMRKMGIEQEELEGVESVVIVTRDRELVFEAPDVVAVTAQGSTTYQVSGKAVERPRGATGATGATGAAGTAGGAGPEGAAPATARPKYTSDDVALVVAQTGASEAAAREALDACDGEVAEAIIRLIG